MQGFACFAAFECAQRVPPHMFSGRPKTGMWPMLRDCRSGNSLFQPVQTCYYLTGIMFIVLEEREQLFIMYLLKSNKKKVAKLHVFRAPKNRHVADVARLPFGQFFVSTRTNVLLSHGHHVHCARGERTAFHYVFIEIKQKTKVRTRFIDRLRRSLRYGGAHTFC